MSFLSWTILQSTWDDYDNQKEEWNETLQTKLYNIPIRKNKFKNEEDDNTTTRRIVNNLEKTKEPNWRKNYYDATSIIIAGILLFSLMKFHIRDC